MASSRSQGSDVEEGIALATQPSAGNNNGTNPDVSGQIQGGQPSTSYCDTTVGKMFLIVAYIVPIIWLASKITMDPLILYSYVIDDDNKCVAFDAFRWTWSRAWNLYASIINMVSLLLLVINVIMNVGLLKNKFEQIIWLFLLLLDLWPLTGQLLRPKQSQSAMTVVEPYPGVSVFNSASIFLIDYFCTVCLTYLTFIRATNMSATLAKATWAKAAFNLLLYLHGGHVLGGLWYAFTIAKEIDCWMKVCKKYASSYCLPSDFLCGHVGNDRINSTTLNEMCPTKTRNTIIYDFGIYHEALESGIMMESKLYKRILHCLRWGLQNLSSFGQNLRASTDTWENIFVISITIYGVVLFVFFIGNMQMYLQLKTQRSEQVRQKKEDVERSKLFATLPKNIQKQIKRYQPDKWKEIKDVHFENLFNNVSDEIKKSIKRELCFEKVKNAEAFTNWTEDMLKELCDCAKPVSYTQYAQIILMGSLIDEMLILVHGKLQTYSLTNANIGPANTNISMITTGSENATHGRISINHHEDGMFFAKELVDWFQDNPNSSELPTSTRTIQAVTKVDAFALKSYDLKNLFSRLPAARASAQEQVPPVESQPQTLVESQPSSTSEI